MNFFNKFSITASATALLTVLGILNNIIITRQIGVSGRGQYSVIMTFILICSLLFGEGLRRSNIILIGKNRNLLSDLFTKSFYFSLLLTGFLLFISTTTTVINDLVPNITSELLSLSIISVVLIIFWQSNQYLLLGLQKIVNFNILQIGTIVVTFVINVIGILFFGFMLFEIILSFAFSTLITLLMSVVFIKRTSKLTDVKEKAKGVSSFKFGWKSTISGVFGFTVLRGAVFFSNYYLDSFQTGLYSIALLLFELLQKLPNTIGTLVLSQTVGDSSSTNSHNTAKLIRTMFVIDILYILFLFIFGEYFIILLFGKEFSGSYILVLYLAPAFLFIGPASVIHAFFMGKGYPNKLIFLNAAMAALTVILFILFVESHGVAAVSSITSLVMSIWTISFLVMFKLETNISLKKILFMNTDDIKYLMSGISSIVKR